MIGLTRSLAVELGREGITVNCICPGPILTGMTARIRDEHKTIYAKRRTALRRYGDPEEVAHMTLSLCLPAASYITGADHPGRWRPDGAQRVNAPSMRAPWGTRGMRRKTLTTRYQGVVFVKTA